MSSQSWKEKEREVCRKFEGFGFSACRAPGSGNRELGISADVVFYDSPSETDPIDLIHSGELDISDLNLVEVKYSKDCSGFKKLYYKHLELCGMMKPVYYPESDVVTIGLDQLLTLEDHMPLESGSTLNSYAIDLLEGEDGKKAKTKPDLACVRGSLRGWPTDWLAIIYVENYLEIFGGDHE